MRLLAATAMVLFIALASGGPSAAQQGDIRGNTSTTAVLRLGSTVYSSLETVGDHDWFKMELEAGHEYQVRIHGVGVTELNDPFIELRDASGNSLGTVDDMSPGTSWGGANVTDPVGFINVSSSGTFFLDISSFVDGSTADDVGDYMVTLVKNPPDSAYVFTLDEIAWQLTNNYSEWTGYDSAIAFTLGAERKLSYDVSKLTPAGVKLAKAALDAWSDVTGIKFVKVSSGEAQLDFDDSAFGLNAYVTPSVSGTSIASSRIMITTGWLNQFGTGFGSHSYETYIQMVGRALGLGLAGNYSQTTDDQYYKNDSPAYSVMSLSQAANDEFTPGEGPSNPDVQASFRYMQTPSLADIIAIQKLYGARTRTRRENTTYGFNADTGSKALDGAARLGTDMFMCIYDDDGIDTLDLSRAKVRQLIDLRSGGYSNVLGGKMNLCIARGVTIENAIGGSGNDRLTGNASANRLTGGDGRDTFVFATKLGEVDRIEDFDAGDDMIELSRSVFKELAVGDLPRAAFKDLGVDGARVDVSDRLIYDRGSGALSYDPDGKGGEPAIRFATIRTKARLTAANFVVR